MLIISHIGRPTTIPGWPEADTIDGLLDALARWDLDLRQNYAGSPYFQPHPDRRPFRGPACIRGGTLFSATLGHWVYQDGPPQYPEAPTAVTFAGNFTAYSFGFSLTTDDRELIARLDDAIAANLERQRKRTSVFPC